MILDLIRRYDSKRLDLMNRALSDALGRRDEEILRLKDHIGRLELENEVLKRDSEKARRIEENAN